MPRDPALARNRLHALAVASCAWLVLTSPWVGMLRRIPREAGFLDWAHVVVGFAALAVGALYAAACVRAGAWRSYFPWVAGGGRAVGRDVAGLLRGRLPSAEGGGLYATIEGLLLVALVVAGLTGAGWALTQGGADVLVWRDAHVLAARTLIGLAVLHVLAVAAHLFELA